MTGAETSSVLLSEPLVVGTVHSPECIRAALRIKPGQIDLLELRVDHFAEGAGDLERAAGRFRIPLIITVRHPAEGGQNRLSPKRRRDLYARFMPLAAFIDVELRSLAVLADTLALARTSGVRVILSEHHFHSTPSTARLRAAIRRASGAGADLCKLAVRADRVSALHQLLSLFIPRPLRPLSVMAMGRFGKISRVLFAATGSIMNYGYLSAPNASGQWPAVTLKERLRELKS
jgi:3-dehydroquinate dehydratase-1